MKALILAAGLGSRMGKITEKRPKCMVKIGDETIIGRQLRQLAEAGIYEVVITTGAHEEMLVTYCQKLGLPLSLTFVNNPRYRETNYILKLRRC